ncbi:MAG: endonuclease/exonuclease/phosphatase family protein [Bacteroidetes bacterium]|nr:endonuclease/exonuclease/phosphatase family protein [Bacteroidota bacterium]
MYKIILVSIFIFSLHESYTQTKKYKIATIGFYNLENLYDTLDDPLKKDDEFTPNGTKKYISKVYLDKLDKLSTVISEIATDVTPDGAAILGVAEIENRTVLEDLCKTDKLKSRNYKIVHYDSPDERGVDVAMLYNPKYFKLLASKSITLSTYHLGGDRPTRDILWVTGLLDGDTVHLFINHWPSRGGGEELTAPFRNEGGRICKHYIDSLIKIDANAKCLIMGDLNDNPTNPSCSKILSAVAKPEKLKVTQNMLNPWINFYKKGTGTLAYQDVWSLFDQIILSYGFVKADSGYLFKQAFIYSKPYMVTKTGRYKGYPLRTYDFDNYNGGYSDHFPTYIFVLKEVKE